jgi:hypothetical protein
MLAQQGDPGDESDGRGSFVRRRRRPPSVNIINRDALSQLLKLNTRRTAPRAPQHRRAPLRPPRVTSPSSPLAAHRKAPLSPTPSLRLLFPDQTGSIRQPVTPEAEVMLVEHARALGAPLAILVEACFAPSESVSVSHDGRACTCHPAATQILPACCVQHHDPEHARATGRHGPRSHCRAP